MRAILNFWERVVDLFVPQSGKHSRTYLAEQYYKEKVAADEDMPIFP